MLSACVSLLHFSFSIRFVRFQGGYEITLLCVRVSPINFFFYVARVVSKESRRLILPKTSCLSLDILSATTQTYQLREYLR
jgi:hypothetical protein